MAMAVVVASQELIQSVKNLAPLEVLDVFQTRDGTEHHEVGLLVKAPDWLDGTWLCPIIRTDGRNRKVEDWGNVSPNPRS